MDKMYDHVDDNALEAYAFQRLAGQELETFEDHLMLCEACRCRLEETELFVKATREAARRIREEEFFRATAPPLWRRILTQLQSRQLWTAAAATAMIAATLLVSRVPPAPSVYQDVPLASMRGAGSITHPRSKAFLRLNLDLDQLPPMDQCQVIVVDSVDRKIWESTVLHPQGTLISVALDRKLASGMYWVRLSNALDGKPLREYPLLVE